MTNLASVSLQYEVPTRSSPETRSKNVTEKENWGGGEGLGWGGGGGLGRKERI